MAGRISPSTITAVREQAPLDKVARDYLALTRAGADSVKGLCPFHDERTPSFHITPTRGMFFCFSCQEGGDVITFIQKINNIDFSEAVEMLAERFNIPITYDETTTPGSNNTPTMSRDTRKRLIAANHAAADWFHNNLHNHPEAGAARDYLAHPDRRFTPEDANQFHLGYALRNPRALTAHLTSLGYTTEELETAGLASKAKDGALLDRFRGRLIFPIHDASSDIIGFGARRIHDDDRIEAKYLNTSETPLYKKNRVLYGLHAARKKISQTGRVVIVEGYTDVMAMHLSGHDTAVATCGTSLTEEHLRLLRRHLGETGETIYTFDGDAAGQKAALRAYTLDPTNYTRATVAIAPNNQDPCELRANHGPETVRELIDQRIPLLQFVLATSIAGYDTTIPEQRANALAAVAPILDSLKDPDVRAHYVKRVALWSGSTPDAVQHHLTVRAPADTPPRATPPSDPAPSNPSSGIPHPHPNDAPADRALIRGMLAHPTETALLREVLTSDDFIHPAYAALYAHLTTSPETTPADPVLANVITELSHSLNASHRDHLYATAIEMASRRATRLEHAASNPDLNPEQALDALLALEQAKKQILNLRAKCQG